MAELIDKWDVVSKLITLENEYQFFKGSEYALDAEKMYRRICELEIGIGKIPGLEVVRCKDCKHYMTIHCTCDGCCISDNWYCADGERKDND